MRLRRALLTVLCLALGVIVYTWLNGRTVGSDQVVLAAPQWLALCACLPLMAAQRPSLALLSRGLLAISLSLCLARPVRVRESRAVRVVLALDVSDSIDQPARDQQRAFVQRVQQERADNPPVLLEFARDAARASARGTAGGDETNLQRALQRAYGLLDGERVLRVVLLTDGKQTAGDLLGEASRAARLGIELDYLLLSSQPKPSVGIQRLMLPSPLEAGRPFQLQAELSANVPSDVSLRLLQTGTPAPLARRQLHLSAGPTTLAFPLIAHLSGPLEYTLELTANGPDQLRDDNQSTIAATVSGSPRVLLVDRQPEQLDALARALTAHAFQVDVRYALGMPRTAAELAGYDFVVLSDVPAASLPAASIALLEPYVRDQGGGLMMAGGDASFGLGGYQQTRLAQLLPVTMAGEIQRQDPSLALALLIDCSGSMAGSKIELAKQAAQAAAAAIAPSDLIEVIGFAGEATRLLRLQRANNRLGVVQNIARLAAQGGTQLFAPLDLAYQDLTAARAQLKHVILLTDGQTQEIGISELVQAMHAENITISTVGLGHDVQRELLQMVANLGGGRAYFTDDPTSVPRIFVHEATSLRRSSTVDRPTRMRVREPADFLVNTDIALAPGIAGYVATQAKPAPAQVILESQNGEPLLARTRVGLGYALAFTPDLKARWTADLLRWPGFARFFAQLVREHQRKPESAELPLQVHVRDGAAEILLDARDADRNFIHDLDASAQLIAGGPRVRLHEQAPGLYEGTLPLPAYGTFALRVTHARPGGALEHSHAVAYRPYPDEYAPGSPNRQLLEAAATRTHGRAVSEPHDVFRPAHAPISTRRELWPYVAWSCLGLFLLDQLLRRIRKSSH